MPNNSKKQNLLLCIVILSLTVLLECLGFQFKAPYISVTPTTINTYAQYSIYLQRQFTENVTNTPWNTVAVPAGSSVTVIFPVQFVFSGGQTCDQVVINSNLPQYYNCTVNISNRTISINGAIFTSQFISDVNIIISNVLNPSPAVTTSAFLATVGNDYSANNPFSAVSLSPATLNQSIINFNPNTVNTTSDMIFTIVTTNTLPVGSTIIIKFPTNNAWTEDVSSATRKLPIATTMSCTSLSPTVNASLQCTGIFANQQMIVSSISNIEIPALSTLKFSINGLFTPPTESPVDQIGITTSISNNPIDIASPIITGLTAKNFTDLTIVATTSTKTINTNIGLRIGFTLQDTITNADYFQVTFPVGTTVTYSTQVSSFSLNSNATYSSTTGILNFTQSVSPTRFTGFYAYITFLTFRTPNSTKPTDPILFTVMRSGGAKMRGSAIFIADPKVYNFTAATNDTSINAFASYTLNFNLADALDRTGYIVLSLPSQLIITSTIPVISIFSSSPTSINLTPTITSINSTHIKISNLNRTSTSSIVPTQTLSLILTGGIRQPNSARNISSFGMAIFYSQEGYLTATGSQSNQISIVSGVITGVNITSTAIQTATYSDLLITMNLQNSVPILGMIYLTIPAQISIASVSTCNVILVSTSTTIPTTFTLSSQKISITLSSTSIPSSSQIRITLSPIITPISTQPTSTFSITTTNSANFTIDNLLTITTFSISQPIPFANIQINRGSIINYDTTQYVIGVIMTSNIFSNVSNIITIGFPNQIVVTNISMLSVNIITPTNSTITPTYILSTSSPLKLSISLPSSIVNLTGFTFQISPLINPFSLKPTSNGILVSTGFNVTLNSTVTTYLYANGQSNPITNGQTADFVSLSYVYSSGILFSDTNVTINVGLLATNMIGYMILQLDSSSLKFKDNTTLAFCTSPQLTIGCTITFIIPPMVKIVPVSSSTFPLTVFSFTIGLLSTPTSYANSYPASTITSYDSSNYAVSRNSTFIILKTSCSLPCYTCITNQPSQCLSCYSPTQNFTSLLFYAQTSGVSYGQCYNSCPSGYFLNSSYICLICNSNCVQCSTTSNTCSLCSNTTFLFSGNKTCMNTCPVGTYGVISTNNTCVNCPTGCQNCSSSTVCSKCASGYFLYNSICSTSCPANITVANSTTRSCNPCSTTCITCLTYSNFCTSCPSDLVLSNNSCLNSCPSQSMTPINNTCTACSTTCLTCSLSIINCTSCNLTTTFKNLYNNQCLQQCPQLYYSSVSSGYRCLLCSGLTLNCTNCTGDGLSCLSCDTGFVYLNGQCLGYLPNGYVNISGNATPCSTQCLTCSITTTNCTSCASSLIYYSNTCISGCPNSTILYNSTCTACSSSCNTCSTTPIYCTSCAYPYFLDSTTHQCVINTSCPSYTYPNSTTSSCSQCVSPCLQCMTSIYCQSCVHGFYFQSLTTLCLDVCPLGWVGVVDVCLRCASPCRYCEGSVDNCTACISGYYLNLYTHQCLLQCPNLVTISNPITMTCDTCTSSCITCQNQTSSCLSCILGTFLIGIQCLATCPPGYYGDSLSKTCKVCSSICLTCVNNPTTCLSCPSTTYFYQSSCLTVCPAAYGIVGPNNICQQCGTVLSNCITCTSQNICLVCQSGILLNGACYSSCPAGYVYDQTTISCITTDQNASKQLSTKLSSSSIFPMPFTCIGLAMFIACVMSKLQNKNTYLIGSAYSLSGLLQTASIAYLIIRYINYNKSLQANTSQLPTVNEFPLITVGIIIIYIINLLGFIIQTPLLCSDTKFQTWLKNTCHRIFFSIITILSLAINYKIKLIIFCKMFSFTTTRCQLQSIDKFRMFNILSFLGVSHQIFIIYMSAVMLTRLPNSIINNQMFFVFVDIMIVCLLSIILSIAANKKEEDFFSELTDNGYILNKKVMVQGDDLGHQGMQPKYLKGNQNKLKENQMDSFQKMLNPAVQQIYQDQQISLSISENKSQIERRQRNQIISQNKIQNDFSQNDMIQIQKYKMNTKRSKITNKQLHLGHQQTANPINKQTLQSLYRNKDEDQISRHSVIFQRQKKYNQAQIFSKNISAHYGSPPKSIKKQIEKKEQIFQKQVKQKQCKELQVQQNIKLQKSGQKIKNQQQSLQKLQTSSLKNNFFTSQNIQQNKKQKKLKGQNQTKIYKEQKDLLKDIKDTQQIENKIKIKMRQLQGLKKEISTKDLKKSRQKSHQKPTSFSVKDQIIAKNKKNTNQLNNTHFQNSQVQTKQIQYKNQNKQQLKSNQMQIQKQKQKGKQKQRQNNKDKQKQKQKQQEINKIFKQDFNNIDVFMNEGQQVIQQISALMKYEAEQKQKYLPAEKQHQTIRQQIDMTTSLSLSKLITKNLQQNKPQNKLNTQNKSIIKQQIAEKQAQSQKSNLFEKKRKTQTVEDFLSNNLTMGKQEEKRIITNNSIKQQINEQVTKKNENPQKNKNRENIQNMYDSFIKNNLTNEISQKSANNQVNNQNEQKIQQKIYNNHFIKNQDSNRLRIGIGIGETLQEVQGINLKNENQESKNKKRTNIFDFQQEENDIEDSGLQDSHPDFDDQINHHPLKSSIASERRSMKQDNNSNIPSIGNLQIGANKNQIPRMADEAQNMPTGQGPKTAFARNREQGTIDDKTLRKHQYERPPLHRPPSSQKNRFYAAGLRQFQDPTITKKGSYEQYPLNKKIKKGYQQDSDDPQSKNSERNNNSLYNLQMNKLESRESKQITSSDHTQDILIKPGYFNPNSSSDDISFTNPKYTSTVIVDSGNDVPLKPSINLTARNNIRISTSHQRGNRARFPLQQNATAGDKMFTKKSLENQDQQDENSEGLEQYYGKRQRKSKSPKRSKSKQRQPSKQSTKRMKQIQKVYLQRLQLPKRKQ